MKRALRKSISEAKAEYRKTAKQTEVRMILADQLKPALAPLLEKPHLYPNGRYSMFLEIPKENLVPVYKVLGRLELWNKTASDKPGYAKVMLKATKYDGVYVSYEKKLLPTDSCRVIETVTVSRTLECTVRKI